MNTPCVEFEGAKNKNGYGVLPKAVHGSRLAHRAMLAEKLGRPVVGVSRHSCDNPPCINPEHLAEGTHADNVDDKVSRGRQRGGRYNQSRCKWGHELTPDNVRLKRHRTTLGVFMERVCRTCTKRRNIEQAARRKAARHAAKFTRETDQK